MYKMNEQLLKLLELLILHFNVLVMPSIKYINKVNKKGIMLQKKTIKRKVSMSLQQTHFFKCLELVFVDELYGAPKLLFKTISKSEYIPISQEEYRNSKNDSKLKALQLYQAGFHVIEKNNSCSMTPVINIQSELASKKDNIERLKNEIEEQNKEIQDKKNKIKTIQKKLIKKMEENHRDNICPVENPFQVLYEWLQNNRHTFEVINPEDFAMDAIPEQQSIKFSQSNQSSNSKKITVSKKKKNKLDMNYIQSYIVRKVVDSRTISQHSTQSKNNNNNSEINTENLQGNNSFQFDEKNEENIEVMTQKKWKLTKSFYMEDNGSCKICDYQEGQCVCQHKIQHVKVKKTQENASQCPDMDKHKQEPSIKQCFRIRKTPPGDSGKKKNKRRLSYPTQPQYLIIKKII